MQRFMASVVTEVDFVDGDNVPDAAVENYERHLAETLQEAANQLSLATINGTKVLSVQVGEIKASL